MITLLLLILFLIIIPIIYTLIKLILYFIVCKFGKFSYDGFSAAGFAYDEKKDIFYSTKNAWQRNFGYSHIYDVLAPIFRMIIDTETIKFYYNHKNWLISFWKGQYGIVTGAEIGIYNTIEQKVNKKTVYMPISNEEMLDMCIILYKKDKEVMRACAKHWWLAIFKLGMFSNPKQLTMAIKICFPNYQMLEAFLKAFKKIGYKDKDFEVCNCTFIFIFKKPHTHKVWTRFWITDFITQKLNRKNVNLYNDFLEDYVDDNKKDDSKNNNHDNLIIINDLIPEFLKNPPNYREEAKYKFSQMIDKNNVVLTRNTSNNTQGENYEQKTK